MDFKSLLSQLDQLNEATKETGKGRIHTAEPGGYGRKDDEDEEERIDLDKVVEEVIRLEGIFRKGLITIPEYERHLLRIKRGL